MKKYGLEGFSSANPIKKGWFKLFVSEKECTFKDWLSRESDFYCLNKPSRLIKN
ncbi:hypothetical protein BY458DRAFT_520565 [Sporodiniella umbellata]|nr:hypothetical protein BY458DRAFT_520565 [Sporodiniella umbellata]